MKPKHGSCMRLGALGVVPLEALRRYIMEKWLKGKSAYECVLCGVTGYQLLFLLPTR